MANVGPVFRLTIILLRSSCTIRLIHIACSPKLVSSLFDVWKCNTMHTTHLSKYYRLTTAEVLLVLAALETRGGAIDKEYLLDCWLLRLPGDAGGGQASRDVALSRTRTTVEVRAVARKAWCAARCLYAMLDKSVLAFKYFSILIAEPAVLWKTGNGMSLLAANFTIMLKLFIAQQINLH